MSTVGKELYAARRASGLTLRQVSAQGGVSPSGLSMIESGQRHPTLHSLQALARVLGVVVTVSPRGVTVERSQP